MAKRNRRKTQLLFPDNVYPYSHPEEPNIQITPYKGEHRTEYNITLFLDPEPTTTAQRRREEIALGIFK